MLEVQKYLISGKTLSDLKSEFGIESTVNTTDSRVILNYNMIESPKTHEISRECRGLVLDSSDWSLVSRSFYRFFNAGEVKTDDAKFHWDNRVLCTHKEDGSFINVCYWNNSWRVHTKASFATGNINDGPFTWESLFKSCISLDTLDRGYTYTFELCSLYNKVVRHYRTPKVYLLSAFLGELELTHDATLDIAKSNNIDFPHTKEFNDIFDVQAYIAEIANNDPTFEGLVCRDVHNNRLKVKSSLYLHLHRLNNNGNIASIKNILPLIMAGEVDEVLTYFNELQDYCDEIQSKLDKAKKEIDNIWYCHCDEPSQKAFAKAIKDTKYSGVLFNARKLKVNPLSLLTPEYLIKVWNE